MPHGSRGHFLAFKYLVDIGPIRKTAVDQAAPHVFDAGGAVGKIVPNLKEHRIDELVQQVFERGALTCVQDALDLASEVCDVGA